jgi:hypothetical protein
LVLGVPGSEPLQPKPPSGGEGHARKVRKILLPQPKKQPRLVWGFFVPAVRERLCGF